MKWYDDRFNDSSSLVLPTLYKVNDDIYDELIETSPGQYLYKKRCGITPYVENHNFTHFITNGEYIIYELPISEQTETILTRDELASYSDTNTTILYGNTNVSFDFELDRRYKEYREDYNGKRFSAKKENMNLLDDGYHYIKVYEITADDDNVSELTISGQTFQLPVTLNTGDRLVWQSTNKSYIYYPVDETQDFEYCPCECIVTSTLAESTNDTLYSHGAILEETFNEITGNNEIQFTSVNDRDIENLTVGGAIINASKLPEGYTELDYISSNTASNNAGKGGTVPYIKTDYYADYKNTTVELKFTPLVGYPNFGGIFGGHAGSMDTDGFGVTYSDLCFSMKCGTTPNASYKITLNDTYSLSCGDGFLNLVDENNSSKNFSYDVNPTTFSGRTSYPMFIFARGIKDAKDYGRGVCINLYYLKIYESGTLVREYIPCKNPSGVVGMYDTVAGKFWTDADSATKDFINGNDATHYLGFGGEFGQSGSIVINQTNNNSNSNYKFDLNSPLLPGETANFVTGIINRKYRTIQNYNGETISTQWYSSNGKLEIGSTVVYEVSPYTELSNSKFKFSTSYDLNKFTVNGRIKDCVIPIKLKYNSTDYSAFSYKITFNSDDSQGIDKLVIHGSEVGVGTHVTDGDQDYYKLTLIIQDNENKQNQTTFDVPLNGILFTEDALIYDDKSALQELYEQILSVSNETLLRFDENVEDFSMEYVLLSNIDSNCNITISLPYKEIRKLVAPIVSTDMSVGSGNGYGQISWDEVCGATEYNVMIDGDVFATIDNHVEEPFLFKFDSEIDASMYVVASNDIGKSINSDTSDILSVPNSTDIENVSIMYETNKYNISFKFKQNSNICDYYKFVYTVDDGTEQTINIEPTVELGETEEYNFNVPDIADKIILHLLPTNGTGSNNYTDAQTFITVDDFSAWTYKVALQQMLLCWYDMLNDEDRYVVRYRINRGAWIDLQIDSASGVNNRMLEYINVDENSIIDVCLAAVIGGKTQVFTKSIRISKALDTMLLPPIGFTGDRKSYGHLEFDWEDNGYGHEHTYLLQIIDAISGQTKNIPIEYNESGKYHYNYDMDGYGYVTAKVKMQWELGESEYSQNVMVYNIEVTYDAPPLNRQEHVANQLKISWQYYNYVTNYVLYLTINNETQEIITSDFEYYFNIPTQENVYNINAKVKAIFIDGSETNISDSLSFNICQNNNKFISTIYTHTNIEHYDYTTIYNKGLVANIQNMYTISTVQAKALYDLYTKFYEQYLFTEYPYYENTFGKNLQLTKNIQTIIASSHLLNYNYFTKVYGKININNIINTIITTPSIISYPIYSEFTKLIIACFGDSITAGHPNFWAETGTGIIESQYEYWLSRRLKDAYDVINKGYGQEKTADMLNRFDRDIGVLQPHYCIILGGTNDWYQDASTHDLATGYTVMDMAIDNIKQMVQKCLDKDIYAIVGTLTPRNDITEDGKTLFDYFNDWVIKWTTEQSILGKKCAYIDFFNAGKDLDPPVPLEDPEKPYHLNPLCDGDNVYDENGNLIRSGLGVHMNVNGYKVMGYSIPTTLFKSADSGFKLYRDAECDKEEKLNTEEASNQFYEISIQNVRRGVEKQIIRYVKNIGNYPTLYYIYINSTHNIKYYFIDEQGNKVNHIIGTCGAGISKQLTIVIEPEFEDYSSDFEVHMVTRELTSVANNL